jgi:RND superfamily putative drug exporter
VILMIVVFGSLVAALLPLAIGVLAIFATFAGLDLLTHVTSVSVFAINLATGLGLGLGMDYALLMVSRFREELAKGVDVDDAVARTMATAGRTIAFSALAVAAALSAMLVFPVYFLKSFAYAGVGVTIFSATSALVVLPALLAVLGGRVNSGRIRGIRTVRSVEAPFWGRLASGVMRRPVVAALPVVAVLLFLATPLLSVTFGTPDERVLPTNAASHQVGDALRNDFATTPDVIDVLITPALPQPQLQSYTQQLSQLTGVQRADISVGSASAGQPASQRVSLSTGLDAHRREARDQLPPATGRGADRGDHLRPAVPVHGKHPATDPGPARQRAHPWRDPRRDGVDLPGRSLRRHPRLHPETDRYRDAGSAVLHRLRALDGLRTVRHQPDQGTARCRCRQL